MAVGEGHPHLVFDLEHEAGVAEIWSDPVTIREYVEHGRGRYSQTPPPGTKIRGPGWPAPSSNREGVAIVPSDLIARDRVIVFDLLGDPDGVTAITMHATDVVHAVLADPKRWSRELPKGAKVVKQVMLAG